MNPTHIHLLVTHLPIFGSILGALVLAYGIWANSDSTKMAAYFIFIVAALGGTVAYLTGEPAEESVEHIAGVSKDNIEEHEESALFTLISLIATGVVSIAGVFLIQRKAASERAVAIAAFVIALASFGMAVRTGYLGGYIRHQTEIDNPVVEEPQGGETSGGQ